MADEEQRESLPVGDPEAGYLPPEPGGSVGTGTLPDVEQDALDAQVEEYEKQSKAIAEHEDKVAKERAKGEGGAVAETPPKATTRSSGSGSS